LNLLSNAVKFTTAGGAIDVRGRERGEFLEISVTDTGSGIAKEDQLRVFDAFYQTELAAQGSSKGTGLGLAITKQLVELHGGTIQLASNPGEGSSFTVSFPIQRQQKGKAQAAGSGDGFS
jgi:signal transduction histidine kinase